MIGLWIVLDDSVNTKNINGETALYIIQKGIFDLTGIEDFSSLTVLDCSHNELTSIDVSQNDF
jgi:Leucine-rich repeat (LRR) protein